MTTNAEGRQFLYGLGWGFLFCLVLLWFPAHEALQHSREGRAQEIDYIKTDLLGAAQRDALEDWEAEGTYFAEEDQRQDARSRQPQAK